MLERSNEFLGAQPALEAYSLLRQINSMLEIFNRYDLRGESLTVPQFAILSHATPEGVPLSTISAQMLCDNSNLTGIVDRLISKGLVERRPDPQDRRVSLICLTPLGTEKLRSIRPRHHESVRRRMHSLSEKEMQQLRDLLHTLHEGLEDVLEDERSVPTTTREDTKETRKPRLSKQNSNRNGVDNRLSVAPEPTITKHDRTNGNGTLPPDMRQVG